MTRYPLRQTKYLRAQRQGFTLIEILVVLAIVAIVSSITLGGFKEMTSGNKRVSCQTNLVQIYQAARLYAGDEGGKFPAYSNPCNSTPPSPPSRNQVGTGLWKLYTFPTKPEADTSTPPEYKLDNNAPIERYLRSSKVLHCPADADGKSDSLLSTGTSVIDQDYLSYQTCDDGDETPGTPGTATYQTVRTTDDSTNLWKRQLEHRNASGPVSRIPDGSTVVTYCIYHRGERDMDNVLFYDGTVQLLPRQQTNPSDVPAPSIATYPVLTDWKRKPKSPQ